MLNKPTALYFAMLVVMLDAMGFGLLAPILPELLLELGAKDDVEGARIAKWLSFAYAGMQFLFSTLLGALSDRFGRKPVLVVSVATLGIDYLILGFAPAIWVLFVGRLIAGVAGATFSTCFAVAADVSEGRERAANIGLVSAGFGLGFILGPLIGGLLGDSLGPRAPVFAAAVISGINFLFGLFLFRESHSVENRRALSWASVNPFLALFALRRVGPVIFLVGAYFAISLAGNVYPSVWSFYTKALLDWSPAQIGVSFAIVGAGFVLTQTLVLPMLLKRFTPGVVLVIGLGFMFASHLGYALAGAASVIYVMLLVSALAGVANPALNSLITNTVDKTRQGEIQGVLASMLALSLVATPFIHNDSFAFFISPEAPFFWPGAPFAVSALLVLIAGGFVALAPKGRAKSDEAAGQ